MNFLYLLCYLIYLTALKESLNGYTPEYDSPIPLPEIKPTLRIRRLVNPSKIRIKGPSSPSNLQRQLIQNGKAAYTLSQSNCGKKGIFISNPEAIGQHVFVSDAEIGTTIKTTIKGDKCDHCGRHSFRCYRIAPTLDRKDCAC